MAHLLNAESVSLAHPARRLLDGVSLGLDDGARVGVVGRNGGGKTTLLEMLARRREPDAGRVTHARGLRLGLLGQHDRQAAAGTVRHTVLGAAADHEWAADPRARSAVQGLLGGLGGLDAPLERLSGGQRRRVSLAALLVQDLDVLLLDEPTNHLDIDGVAWLAEHLAARWPAGRGALVLVTHDRWFLDAVCTRTWEVHDGAVTGYDGGYAAYVLARAERARVAAATDERRRNLLRKELAWLRRGPPARTTKPRFRIDAATELIAGEPPPRDDVALQRLATARLGRDVVDLEDVTLGFGGRVLLNAVTWRLAPGERVGVVGTNGSGKTSLLRLLLGDLQPDAGRVRRGVTVRAAMLTQDVRELDPLADQRVLPAVEQVRAAARLGEQEIGAAQLLERLGFSGERMLTPIGELSGGERRRLQLLRLLMTEPNLLLLDEPTNDLDTDTLTAVEDVLDGWPGTLVVVSHDRYLLERVTDRQVALLAGAVQDLPGGVEDYLRRLRAPSGPPATSAAHPAGSRRAGTDQRQVRKQVQLLERAIERLTREEAGLHEQLVAHATDHQRLLGLDARLREVVAQRARLEDDWLTAAEQLP